MNPEPVDKQMMFDDMLAGAMNGRPLMTENGMNDAIEDALIRVAVLRTQESADAARAVFDEHYGPDAAKPAVPN
jgi:hypothetical protein